MGNPICDAVNTVRSVLGCMPKPIQHGRAVPVENSNRIKLVMEMHCPRCAKKGTMSILNKHKYVRSNKVKYTCPNCDYSYTKF